MTKLTSIILSLTLSISASSQSLLRGTVFDQNDAVIPNLIVRAVNRSGVFETLSNENGDFVLRLPAGIYSISTREKVSSDWHPLVRSSIRVCDGEDLRINLWPEYRVLMRSLEVTAAGSREPEILARRRIYREFSFTDEPKITLKLQYRKLNRAGTFHDIVLTYDHFTIRADSANINATTGKISLNGHVRLYYDSHRVLSDAALITLDRRRPSFEINGRELAYGCPSARGGGSH